MATSLGQYCLYVTDLERSVAFYEGLGLTCTSRTEIDEAFEAIMRRPDHGSSLQLAQRKDGMWERGNAFWKLYINTRDVQSLFDTAVGLGATVESKPERLDRWPVTVAFVHDPDGLLVELVERDPWPDTDPADGAWLGQYCLNVTDIGKSIAFFELLGLDCTSRTEIAQAFEAILESPGTGSRFQLAQQKDQDVPIEMGLVWKLYVNTDDCAGLHQKVIDAGYPSILPPTKLDRWPVTVAFVGAPDGYQIELVQRDAG
jgi:lactoylglutathione lyase